MPNSAYKNIHAKSVVVIALVVVIVSVMFCSEFVAAMVANYLECKQFEDSNDSLCDIVECVILLVNSTVTMHVLTKYDLINSCVDEDYFAELLEQKLRQWFELGCVCDCICFVCCRRA